MNLDGIYNGMAFTGNPVRIADIRQPIAGEKCSFAVRYMDEVVYKGVYSPPYTIDISEIAAAVVRPYPDVPELNTEPLVRLEDSEEFFAGRMITVDFHYDADDDHVEFMAMPGGVAKSEYYPLIHSSRDIFSERFLNHNTNFFLTTRGTSRNIVIGENELSPLYFINANPDSIIEVETTSGNIFNSDKIDPGLYALDIKALRSHFAANHNELPQHFAVRMNNPGVACNVIVAMSEASRDLYRLKFRNSLGVFEIVGITEPIKNVYDIDGAEDDIFNRPDDRCDDFVLSRTRTAFIPSITVKTGAGTRSRISQLLDMLMSDEVYILDMYDTPVKVIPIVKSLDFMHRIDSPAHIDLTLKFAHTESYISSFPMHADKAYTRIFSKQFSKQFN